MAEVSILIWDGEEFWTSEGILREILSDASSANYRTSW